MTAGQRKLHNQVLHNLYSSPVNRTIKSRRMRWSRHLVCMEDTINEYNYTNFWLNSRKGRKQMGENQTDLWKAGWWVWIEFIQLSRGTAWRDPVNTVMNLWVPRICTVSLAGYTTCLSGRSVLHGIGWLVGKYKQGTFSLWVLIRQIWRNSLP